MAKPGFHKSKLRLTCRQCNNIFLSQKKSKTFCSSNCYGKYHYVPKSPKPKIRLIKSCETCKKNFYTYNNQTRYCKRTCRPGERYQRQYRMWVHRKGQGISKYFIWDLMEIYYNRPKGMEVDHIIPLKGKNISGLHVPWNLQYLTCEDNRKKSNRV